MSNNELAREHALELAVSHHRSEGAPASEVVETARAFQEFLESGL